MLTALQVAARLLPGGGEGDGRAGAARTASPAVEARFDRTSSRLKGEPQRRLEEARRRLRREIASPED